MASIDLWPGKGDPAIDKAGHDQCSYAHTARKFDKALLPRRFYLPRKKKILADFTTVLGYVVISGNLRELVESIGSDTFDFTEIIVHESKRGPVLAEKKYFIVNFLDQVDAIIKDKCERVEFRLPRPDLPSIKLDLMATSVIALDKNKIAGRTMWVDKYKVGHRTFLSDELFEKMKAAGFHGGEESGTCVEFDGGQG
ncbi:DUF1629 domain-containing protein [Planktotalea sp.]|uniref:imm11 family protein n=1 Tax=Planktotalea sp. TaxID=2029877 RepID=UPI003297A1A9